MRAHYRLARERRQEARELLKLRDWQRSRLSKLREKIRELKGEDKPCPRMTCTVIREDMEYWRCRVDDSTGWAYVRDLMRS